MDSHTNLWKLIRNAKKSLEKAKYIYIFLGLRLAISRSSHLRCSVKKAFLEISQNSQEKTCARAAFLIKLQACEISMNTFSTERLQTTASEFLMAIAIEYLIQFVSISSYLPKEIISTDI